MKKPTIDKIVSVMRENGMVVFTKPFDMTLGGIRTLDNKSNTFNDWLFMIYYDLSGKLCGIVEPGTTDAGLYYRKNPMIQHGIQHKGVYEYQNPPVDGKLGHNKQEAFRQIKPMDYWRDANRDEYLNFDGETFTQNGSTNGHDMGDVGKSVDKWSAGCWGAIRKVMDKFYNLAKLQIKHGHGSKFSYAMLHETMFK
jgi:hypothetical protein